MELCRGLCSLDNGNRGTQHEGNEQDELRDVSGMYSSAMGYREHEGVGVFKGMQ